jgi:hypothetical protein
VIVACNYYESLRSKQYEIPVSIMLHIHLQREIQKIGNKMITLEEVVMYLLKLLLYDLSETAQKRAITLAS